MLNFSKYLGVIIILVFGVFYQGQGVAGYNDNMNGIVSEILTYPSGRILFKLHNQPSSHPSCKSGFFAIATDVSDKGREIMYSRLLIAYTTKQPVNIGFDNLGDCGSGYIRVHRVG
ncbi:hypothetical protein J8L86_12550 [Shewanella sp. MMG014]|uniref:hypothetical protein n=1 Tax=unclassified Shewanella TaxID=196818 RepID=UPI0006E682B7|nr:MULTISPECIES: hypothetical protein [unclassified Shewanella]KPZ73122.1 hypothetical protein AN944_00270 [Shewanella sp. P1-14-1]MBQ4890682.1 hypothetical protein [Shewanella sp. MMG014]